LGAPVDAGLAGVLDALILHYPSGAVTILDYYLDALKFVSFFGAVAPGSTSPRRHVEMSMSRILKATSRGFGRIREDVARLAETISKLVQRETHAARWRLRGRRNAKTSADTVARRAVSLARRVAKSRPASSAIR